MRNALVFLGSALAALVILFSLINIAEEYLLVMLAIGVLMIGVGITSWRTP